MGAAAALVEVPTRAASDYLVRVDHDWESAAAGYDAAEREDARTPFQGQIVLDSWYRAMATRADLEPVLLSVSDARTGALALHLPLVRLRRGMVRVLAFADQELIDYNAPVLGPAAPRDAEGAAALWRMLRAKLPGADLIELRKMPLTIRDRPNPLAFLRTLPCELNGNLVRIGDAYDAYLRGGIKRLVRKELERSWRVFSRHPEASFRAIVGSQDRMRVLAAIEHQQPIRMGLARKSYALDAPEPAEFYRRLVEVDPTGDTVVLLALAAGDEIVAALLGLREAGRFTMIRISSSTDAAWTNCSPGRLVIERSMAHLHAEGVREFDFSVGNYDYKRRFGVEPVPLVDVVRPLTPLGLAGAARAQGRAWLRTHPELETRMRRLLGRASAQEAAP
ncbi:GNAT family N-acetyltransferase [uncultured Enterovirga sp.]|uniref:GNAT family N-acetyltransferase n=1 Tax=uncultured Enterovirga sp. TaxID=2026352 RepID=UPI0035CB9D23